MTSTLVIATLIILVMALSVMTIWNLIMRQSKAPLPRFEPLPAARAGDNTLAHSQALKPFDAAHWAQMNEWLFEGQADDRRPMLGNVDERVGSASVHRSTSRRLHQASFKQWSKQRHE